MKTKLLLFAVFFSFVVSGLKAQTYKGAWRDCFDNGDRNAQRIPLGASAIDSVGNLYVAGFVNLNHNVLLDSVYLKKYNPQGKVLWEIYEPFKTIYLYGGSTPPTYIAIAVDRRNDIVLSYSYSFISSNVDAVVNKYNSLGKRLWQTVFQRPEETDNEQTKKLNIDDKGNIFLLIAEVTNGNYSYGTLAKFDSKGRQIWYRDMNGTYGYLVQDATLDSSGNVYATGYSNVLPKNYKFNVFTYKFFANGDTAWKARYISDYATQGYRVMYAKKDNSIVVCGQQASQIGTPDSIIAIKYFAGGRQLWIYTGRPELEQTFSQSALDADNNILLACIQTVKYSNNWKAPFLIKLSASGKVIWSEYAFADYVDYNSHPVADIKTDADSHYYLISKESRDVRIQKFDRSGSLLAETMENFDTSVSIYYAALNINNDQSIYAATSYEYYFARTNSCVSKYTMKNAVLFANNDLNHDETVLTIVADKRSFIYPNPAHDVVHLVMSDLAGRSYTVYVFDALGKQVMLKQQSASQTMVDVSSLLPGIYAMKIVADNLEQLTYKFIKL